jgi:lactoylglutathione lyase
MAITGIGHLALWVGDMEKSLHFYCGILGFERAFELVDDIHETVSDIETRGGTLDRPIKTGKDGNSQCWVKDPDGTRIELMQIAADSMQARHG